MGLSSWYGYCTSGQPVPEYILDRLLFVSGWGSVHGMVMVEETSSALQLMYEPHLLEYDAGGWGCLHLIWEWVGLEGIFYNSIHVANGLVYPAGLLSAELEIWVILPFPSGLQEISRLIDHPLFPEPS